MHAFLIYIIGPVIGMIAKMAYSGSIMYVRGALENL